MRVFRRFQPLAAVLAAAMLVPTLGRAEESHNAPPETTDMPKSEVSPSTPAPAPAESSPRMPGHQARLQSPRCS